MNNQPGIPKQEIPAAFMEWAIKYSKEQAPTLNKPSDYNHWRLGVIVGAEAAYRHLLSQPPSPVGEAALRDIILRAERYLREINDDNVHDPSVGLYRDSHLTDLINDIDALPPANPQRAGEEEKGQQICGCGRMLVPIFDKEGKNRIGVTHETIEDEEYHSEYFRSLVAIPSPTNSRSVEPQRIIPDGNYFVAQCDKCGFKGASSEWNGGGQIADTGDYGDSYCPVCGSVECDDADDDTYVDQRELFMIRIGQLNNIISELEWELYESKEKRAGEISPVLNREDVAAIKGKLKADQDDYLERAEAEGISKTDDFEAGYMACIRRMNGILNIRMKEIPPTPAPEVKEEPEDQWHPQDYSGKNSPAEEGKSI